METDQQDQEMRNIYEEVEGGSDAGDGCLREDFSSLFDIVIPFNSVRVHFISSHFSFSPLPFCRILPPACDFFSLSPFTEQCDSIHFANSGLYCIGG